MTIRTRLRQLEVKLHRLRPFQDDTPEDLSDEDWLAYFEAWDREGYFTNEPDFATALALYRDALTQAQAGTDPPFDPPSDFLPHLQDLPYLRLINWRSKVRFPDVHAGWDWLMEMLHRRQTGIPPVSASEFAELARWFGANDARLYQLSLPSQLLELGDGRSTSVSNLRYGLRQGVRGSRAGELAEDLRQLRARYGGESA